MAVLVKTSSTLNVVLDDEAGGTSTFRLNNPVSNLNKTSVENSFEELLGKGTIYVGLPVLICNSSGDKFTAVSSAQIVETTVRTEDLV